MDMEKLLSQEEMAKIQKEQGDAQDVFDEQGKPRETGAEKGEAAYSGLESPKNEELVNLDSERNKLNDLVERKEKIQEEATASINKLRELRESNGFPPNDEKTASQKAFEEAEGQVKKQHAKIEMLEHGSAGIDNKETEEKLNQAKKLLLDSFGNIEKTEVRGNYHVQSRETEATLDEIKSVLKDPSIDQKALADDFFENTIVKDFTSNKQAYKVYRELKGTEFAQRFKELESERLKKAGFGEFRL
ncbi:hypothetical protein A2W48_01075 [Candidatus Giovannonibacteria bacterium RIFCSPHIGHO2_12_44_12]|uniref:Uncharacterized protein n=2 Tax=Candidatus Giovannoniibacteriota TaxID=1752738 RepID=A0A1F5WYD8_9BACT|nr:MAG: hypothetical protein A2W57_03950 [Candidatus Giovannonibacteria bacterium RIFCSPHIGHO2_02_43_16]OGF80648.1 MAG: hypothetical protein A2W48_01075 [Candidatus Giovannonibacteria bacterium RIFCSPHIGHO2_12_44_12]